MKIVEDFILVTTREERRSHLDLNDTCVFRGGTSPNFKGLLAVMLDTNIPSGKYAFLCHACHNSGCSNWKHLYWGTRSDNAIDYRDSPTYKSQWQRSIDKYGERLAKEIHSISCSKPRKNIGNNLPRTRLDQIEKELLNHDLTKRGALEPFAKKLGITPQYAKRLVKKYFPDTKFVYRRNKN